jgi:hypothetical protein
VARNHCNEESFVRNIEVDIITGKGPEQSREFLQENRFLAVMPSRIENSPMVVLECLVSRIPFLATNVGGTSELVYVDDRPLTLLEPTPQDFSKAFEKILEKGQANLARYKTSPTLTQVEWHRQHQYLFYSNMVTGFLQSQKQTQIQNWPKVSAIITHHNRGSFLLECLKSIERQQYPHIEVVVVDDASDDKNSINTLKSISNLPIANNINLKVIWQQQNMYLGYSRNAGVKYASGEFVMFLDEDDIAMEDQIKTMVSVALKTGVRTETITTAVTSLAANITTTITKIITHPVVVSSPSKIFTTQTPDQEYNPKTCVSWCIN